ncbi:3-deoxy-7-phosphoheptulonate synthase [Ammonifex thiophilus]|uniref:3-deoxy-7-phosphoheptulonate synthase n=1 Tax=Ammonifex thiophilus TaxID=444093 RepID=A0A3D8P4X7_9THEO|nr:3-deoxy-7-phosphoheptulonate synthase [Ammonifex thiophilus]RDV84264.1 3-deoxy-7-phosphoheptulonate synthase [Ammonifex thiophilus]
MIVVMRRGATPQEVRQVEKRLRELGFATHPIVGVELTVIGAVGSRRDEVMEQVANLPGVERVVPVLRPYKLVAREVKEETTTIRVGDVVIGGPEVVVIAGPCAVESEVQLLTTAKAVKEAGAHLLRGGAFKPRTSPYSFQGLGLEGLKLLAQAREVTGLPVVTEVLDTRDVELVARYADVLQVGARNMQNFRLLQEVGQSGKPVLLKRGLAATVEEWLLAAEYIAATGNQQIILCERGIRTYENSLRNTLDISAVPLVKELSHLPIIVDPSHATGNQRMVLPLARAAVAAGADGLMIEVHPDPARALSDGPQSLTPAQFSRLMGELRRVALAVGRHSLPQVSLSCQAR